ncbi:hypothetical protein PFISCL1PPCAC_6267, partial [Pristionchus fissidentatus]
RIGKESYNAVKDMHYMWYVHSVKALLVQVAKEIVPKLNEDSERDFLLCLNRIAVKTDIVRTSQCLMEARESMTTRRTKNEKQMSSFVVDNKANEEERRREERKERKRKRMERIEKKKEERRVEEAL